ncbi:MAG: M23 family metallopeptidase [Myxococcota bacterium]|nr:M23 family metallopeptidase [Myxococcota bacterium]
MSSRVVAALGGCILLLAGAEPAGARSSCHHGVCIDHEGDASGIVRFFARHDAAAPVVVTLELELENFEVDREGEIVLVVPPGQRVEMARATPSGAGAPRYEFHYRYRIGDPTARHDAAARYRIPFGGSAPRRLTQGGNGGFSHRGRTAYDFKMPVGTPILAARDGVVALVVDEYERGGRRKSLAGQANLVALAHDDGTIASYVHLERGAVVAVGQRVRAGQRIGLSGNTGYTTAPHLHFEVHRNTADGESESIGIRFEDPSPQGRVPVAGSYYGPAEELPGLDEPDPEAG